MLMIALRQSGNEAARKSLERAAAAAAATKDGSNVGVIEVSHLETSAPALVNTSPRSAHSLWRTGPSAAGQEQPRLHH